MSTVSLVMIVKNEQSILQKALESIKFIADEIIIVDTGSTDRTLEIAKQFTKNIHHFNWIDDFSAARNFADSFATCQYILRWDADWVLAKSDQKHLTSLKQKKFHNKDIINLNWILEFDQQTLQVLRSEPYFFFYKNHKFHWESPIHNLLKTNSAKFTPTSLYQNVRVFHHKDPISKAHRYIQTIKILEQTLSNYPVKDKNYFRLVKLFALAQIHAKNYQKAKQLLYEFLEDNSQSTPEETIFTLEKLIATLLNLKEFKEAEKTLQKYTTFSRYKEYILCQGDLAALHDIDLAKTLYQASLNSPKLNVALVDIQRYEIHPRLILSKILIYHKQLEEAQKYLRICKKIYHKSPLQ